MLLLDAESDAFTDIAKQRAMNRHEVRLCSVGGAETSSNYTW